MAGLFQTHHGLFILWEHLMKAGKTFFKEINRSIYNSKTNDYFEIGGAFI